MEDMRMATKRSFQPVNPIHPGEMLLEEFLRLAGKTQTEFAAARRRNAA
jgi:plasmid maintenance system antidote protein VapI